MKVQILHIANCPNWKQAGTRLRDALNATGHTDAEISYVLLSTPEDAARVPFAGSPTILLDGTDAFPTDGRTTDLACRIYYTETGLAGLPTTAQIGQALRERG